MSAICLDAEWPEIRRGQQDNPATLQGPDDIAYVIYTSGSTGKPKGVEISHRAVINFLHSMRQEPGLSERDVLLSVTSLSFDIAGLEIFLPLSVGATIVLADSETVLDGRRLTTLIADADPTVMQATPSTWQLLLDCGWTGSKRLRILCGGEKLSRVLANHLLECGAELWNLYGPTETTIWSTLDKVGPATEPVPIGRPIANTQTYVLDEQLQPVPAGIAGELYIGGDGLARGYLNRPELNAEKFIPNPFGKPGTRLYRTGDRARYLADGRIEFLGRSDHQVKIRGHRVELGEIESALSTHPAVRRAVAVLREDTPGDPRFIAYFVAESDCLVNATDLHRFLERKIPEYALPSAFIALEELPLSPSGKIDRRALPEPVNGRPVLDRPMIVARSPAEEALAAIWREVLGVPQVGVEDNFFELGGHSLKITQILSRVRRAFGVDLPFAQFFQGPTIAEQAVYIEKLRGKDPITNTVGQGIIQRRTAIRPSRELSQTTR